jgi:hypothetical protein
MRYDLCAMQLTIPNAKCSSLLERHQYAVQLDQSLEAKYMESHGPYHILAILTPPPTHNIILENHEHL